MTRPRIAICGVHIESSTFTPYTSLASDFDVTRGQALINRFPWMDEEWAQAIEWVPIVHARALPGGIVEQSAYEAWKAEILEGLRTCGGLDGLFFDIHGAMSAHGYDDVEGDLITAIREVIGSEPMVSASMDLHGNVSDALFDGCDILTCYRMAPHEDAWESRKRAMRNLAERVAAGKPKPYKAMIHVPILLPGEKTSTRVEPAKSLYAHVPEIEAHEGILDAAIWVGFAWADQPRCTGVVAVMGDDKEAVDRDVAFLAHEFWRVRNEFEFVAPAANLEECLAHGVNAARPYFISDSGDNPGAGGADDVTVALAGLLGWEEGRHLNILHASIFDSESALAAYDAGAGATLTLGVGGKIDTREPGTLHLDVEVLATCDDPLGGKTALVKCENVSFILTEHRNQYTQFEQFERLGVDISSYDVVCVKIGYLEPDLYDTQKDWMMALTPGGVDQDLIRLGHHKITRPLFPFDTDFTGVRFHKRIGGMGLDAASEQVSSDA